MSSIESIASSRRRIDHTLRDIAAIADPDLWDEAAAKLREVMEAYTTGTQEKPPVDSETGQIDYLTLLTGDWDVDFLAAHAALCEELDGWAYHVPVDDDVDDDGN